MQERQTKQVTSSRTYSTTELSRLNKSPKTNNRKRKQLTTRLILSLFDSAKISKTLSKRRSSRQIINVLYDTSQTAEKTTIDFSSSESRIRQIFPIRDAISVSLCLICLSRVIKLGGKRPTELRRNSTKLLLTTGTQRLKKEVNFDLLLILLTDRKVIQQSNNASLRRSTRTSKSSERFCSDYK